MVARHSGELGLSGLFGARFALEPPGLCAMCRSVGLSWHDLAVQTAVLTARFYCQLGQTGADPKGAVGNLGGRRAAG